MRDVDGPLPSRHPGDDKDYTREPSENRDMSIRCLDYDVKYDVMAGMEQGVTCLSSVVR